jgi:hypothetical protein
MLSSRCTIPTCRKIGRMNRNHSVEVIALSEYDLPLRSSRAYSRFGVSSSLMPPNPQIEPSEQDDSGGLAWDS